MKAMIFTTTSKTINIEKLTKIKCFDGQSSQEFGIKDCTNFTLSEKIQYVFIGKNIVAISGASILYVEFSED